VKPLAAALALVVTCVARPTHAADTPESLTVEQAVDSALVASPDLLDVVDRARGAAANLSGTRSLFLPQVTPFYDRTVNRDATGNTTRFGSFFSQQFLFGPRLLGSVETTTPDDATGEYATHYALELDQPLLRGLDPVVTREPLRAARRFDEGSRRAVATMRRQTVVAVWAAYLDAVVAEELVVLAGERLARADKLHEASRAKLESGTVSRLDVLRSEQLSASARREENESKSARDDAHDALARLTGRPPGSRFVLLTPERVPVAVPGEPEAQAFAKAHLEDLLEERDRVKDAEAALRIARSAVLPSVSAFGLFSADGRSSKVFDSFTTPGRPTWSLGLRSEATLNLGLVLGQKAQAQIALETERRRARVLEDDVARRVARSARRLATARERLSIDDANLEVARMQLDVANLRFEKGLSDNFNVVDAENLYHAARVSYVTSKSALLLSELDLLLVSGLLEIRDFVPRK